MKNSMKSNKCQRTGILQRLKIEIEKREPNNLSIVQNWFTPRK